MLRIKELREDNDIKQKKIAELLGIQQNSYSQIENEKNTIQIDHLIKLAKFYNTSTDYLLGLTDEILKLSNDKLCFSKMTFPHQLIRIFLVEQLFRAFKISNNETYHW